MKRITYTVLTAAYLVFLHGAIHSAEVAPPESSSSGNVTQSSDTELKPEGVPAEQPSGEIQERAVRPSGPILKVPQELLPLQPAMTLLPGEFAFRVGGYFLTAVDGGRHITGAFHTDLNDASRIGSWEKYKLYVEQGLHRTYAMQTVSENYVNAVDGGGRSTDPVLQTNQVEPIPTARFRIFRAGVYYHIRVANGQYLGPLVVSDKGIYKVVGLRTDLNAPDPGPSIQIFKCGDLGPDARYLMIPASTDQPYYPVIAPNGGGLLNGAMLVYPTSGTTDTNPYGSIFRFIRQGDGSYAIQTQNGQNYVTAVDGGQRTVAPVLQTNRTQVQAWEKFKLWVHPDCAYSFQTSVGGWLGVRDGYFTTWSISPTRIEQFNKFRLYPADFESPPRDHRQ